MRTFITILITIHLIGSCSHIQVLHKEIIPEGRTLVISLNKERLKGEKIQRLSGTITGIDGKTEAMYNLSTKCGCTGKSLYLAGITHFELVTNKNAEYPLPKDDTLVFKKLLAIPGIEKYCSVQVFDSAQGFIKRK